MSRSQQLSLRHRRGNITTSARTGRTLWFTVPPARWSFRTAQERAEFVDAGAGVYAALVGHRVKIRVTSRPHPVEEWARNVSTAFPDALPGWGKHLVAEQRHLMGMTLSHKEVFLGVDLQAQPIRRESVREEIRSITSIVGGPGINAQPATPADLDWLLHRSASLGHPAPLTLPPTVDKWDAEDFDLVSDRVDWNVWPGDRSVRVWADINGQAHVRHVVVLTLGPMMELPRSLGPWMQKADRLPFPVEWSVTMDIKTPEQVKKWLRDASSRVKAQIKHYAEDHDEHPPAQLQRQEARAIQVEDEMVSTNLLTTRAWGWVRAAVSGPDEVTALERADAFSNLYLPHLPFTRARPIGDGQYDLARSFIPGEPEGGKGHLRRMPVTTFAAAVPAASSVIGDRVGFHIGSTDGSSKIAACWHPWASMEQKERSGTTIVSGGLGSGKSTLLGIMMYWSALAGVRTMGLDPSGPLAQMCYLPELRAVSRAVDLMDAEPGALNPFSVIPNPEREHHMVPREDGMTDEQWQAQCEAKYQRAISSTQATRKIFCVDTLTALLPKSLAKKSSTHRAISDAMRLVLGHQRSSSREVLSALHKGGDTSQYIARTLEEIAELPQVQLIFPPANEREIFDTVSNDYLLQILTLRGNVTPDDDKPADDWTIEERIGIPLLTLAARLTNRHVYYGPRAVRKMTCLDEVHEMTKIAAGRATVRSGARDTRKHNHRLMLSSQDVGGALVSGIDNFIDNSFAGRTEGEREQASALERSLKIPRGVGYEGVLAGLSPRVRQSTARTGFRQFIWNDGDGAIEVVRIDVPPSLRAVLDTTPDPMRVHHDTKLSLVKVV